MEIAYGDRISKLGDGVLGHILSFLPADEAARAAALSTRWRHVFAGVHTVSLEQPAGRPVPLDEEEESYTPGYGPRIFVRARPFADSVSAALLARHRRGAAGAPLRALRVAFLDYASGPNDHDAVVDQWLYHAMQQCSPELHLDLRFLRHGKICGRGYSLHAAASAKVPDFVERGHGYGYRPNDVEAPPPSTAADGGAISDDETRPPNRPRNMLYNVPSGVFSCAALRTLCLGPCNLNPPAGGATSLPSLEKLLLTQVTDLGRRVQRLIAGCPRLADLTLEACAGVIALSLLDNKHLCRLVLRCCHALASVAVDASELRAFDYRGAVPTRQPPFLTMHNGPPRSMSSCVVDLCGEELTSEEDLAGVREFLRLFSSAEHLHLTSARLGSGIDNDAFLSLTTFPTLRHLELTGCLPHDDAAAVAAVTRILERAPNLEVLTLLLKAPPAPPHERNYHVYKEVELLDAHNLRYDARGAAPPPPPAAVPRCLRERVREINLVHYQGGDAQRALARFLLGGVVRLDALYCGFAEGPLCIQVKLMEEIRGWAKGKIEPDEIIFD